MKRHLRREMQGPPQVGQAQQESQSPSVHPFTRTIEASQRLQDMVFYVPYDNDQIGMPWTNIIPLAPEDGAFVNQYDEISEALRQLDIETGPCSLSNPVALHQHSEGTYANSAGPSIKTERASL